ncbi:MAG: DegT/DnrJ/EryC1/StrS family aminotransferase [Alphaproteobacteria bacterium]|nr:DegT/DnrJ/EryC1/StrS family aminotransferase [Alphaproteobacteria bacterium]
MNDQASATRTIPFGKPMLDDAERDAAIRVLSGTTLVHGPESVAFESEFAARVGVAHAVSASSCTAALHLALFASGIGRGDRVAVPAMTHVATAHAIEFCGAEPVFVDVESDTGNIDPAALDAVGGRLAAIMPVHYLGLPCDMDRIGAIAARHGALVIEDCALALDATWDGRKAGTLGAAGCFSFYPIKHMTTLEGGVLTTNDAVLGDAVRRRKSFGYDRSHTERTRPGIYDVTQLGYNYRMNEVGAAVGRVQIAKLDAFQKARADNFSVLAAALAGQETLTVMPARKGKARSSHYCLNVVLPRDGSVDRDAVVARLKAAGVGTSVHYPSAVPLFTYYHEKYGYRPGRWPVTEWLAAQTISLPVGPHLRGGDAEYIGAAVVGAVAAARD